MKAGPLPAPSPHHGASLHRLEKVSPFARQTWQEEQWAGTWPCCSSAGATASLIGIYASLSLMWEAIGGLCAEE